MAMSVETIVSIAGLLVNLPPAILALWMLFKGRNAGPSTTSGAYHEVHD
jgi:hypothetical protein